MEYVLGISGASGTAYGIDILKNLPHRRVLIMSDGAIEVAKHEMKGVSRSSILRLADASYGESEFTAPVASGSHLFDAFIIAPASMNTIAKIANGIADNLLTRVGSIALKERRKFVIVFREMPLSQIHLRNLLTLSEAGVYILPASPGLYHGVKGIDDMLSFVTSRVLDLLGIKNDLIKRWENE
ncbi:MAG: UbiX family flavin prenyltransferase [Thermoplasmatales archaeon]